VHCHAVNKQTAIKQAIATYLETRKLAEKTGIQIAPVTKEGKLPDWYIRANQLDQSQV